MLQLEKVINSFGYWVTYVKPSKNIPFVAISSLDGITISHFFIKVIVVDFCGNKARYGSE